LAEFLLDKGYIVHGIIRRASSFNTARIQHLYDDPKSHRQGRMMLHYGDMTDFSSLIKIISLVQPTEIYNLAAQSHVKVCAPHLSRRRERETRRPTETGGDPFVRFSHVSSYASSR